MTGYHLVCHDCPDCEYLLHDERVARAIQGTHAHVETDGHNVEYAEVAR